MNTKSISLIVLTLLLLTPFATSDPVIIFSNSHIPEAYAASEGWLTGWNCRTQLIIDGSSITESLTDFPALIKLNSSILDFSKAQDNGQDVRFTLSDGTTELKYEVERWDKTNAIAEIWVKIPSVLSGANTAFYLYYCNPAALDAQDKTHVWDTNFKMVQHLKEASGMQYDSTSNHNDGTVHGVVNRSATGKINGADGFNPTFRKEGYVNCGNSSSLTSTVFTIETWVKRLGNGNTTWSGASGFLGEPLVAKGRAYTETPGLNANYFLAINPSNMSIGFDYEDNVDGLNHPMFSNTAMLNGQWYYIALTFEGTAKMYINGDLDKSMTPPPGRSMPDWNPWALAIGSAISGPEAGQPLGFINGTIDEVHFSNNARSANWIKAQYLSMSGQWITFAPPEGLADIAVTHVESSKDYVGQDYNVRINVNVTNQGSSAEIFDLTVCANQTKIETRTIPLTSESFEVVTFTWNTAGATKGFYTLNATADQIPGEIDTLDNTCQRDQGIKITIAGDVNGDTIVNVHDLFLIGKAYDSTPPTNPNCDINEDNQVNQQDLGIAKNNYLKTV